MFRRLAVAFLGLALLAPAQALAQSNPRPVSQSVAVCDPAYPGRCIKPAVDGSLNVNATVTAETGAVATAVAPTYVEGTTNPLSVDLSGNLRTAGGAGGGTTTTATAAAPSLVEGSSTNPISVNLTGDLRTIAKIASGQSVSLTGTLPAFGATPTFNCGTGCSGGGTTAQGAATGGVTGGLSLGSVTTAAPSYTNATVNSLSLTPTGSLRVDGSAATQPVSGTITANIGTVATLATAALQSSVQGTFGAVTGQRAVIYDSTGTVVDWTDPVPITGLDGTGVAAAANPVPTASVPTASSGVGIASSTSTSAESCRVLKAGSGNLYSVGGYASAAGFAMVFNATSAPADGAVTPYLPAIYVPTAGTWSADFGTIPAVLSTGITVCFSSTGPFTKTAFATNNVLSGRVQ
jgi:hypothetical protein